MWASVQHVALLVSSTSQHALSALNLLKSTVIDLSVGAYFGFVCFAIWFLTLAILFDSGPHCVARIESFLLEVWDSFQILIRSKRLVQLRLKCFSWLMLLLFSVQSLNEWFIIYFRMSMSSRWMFRNETVEHVFVRWFQSHHIRFHDEWRSASEKTWAYITNDDLYLPLIFDHHSYVL